MDFDRAFTIVVGIEGNYSNDPKDPGGETKYGISKRAHPSVNIASLNLPQAKSIYLLEYWNPARCNDLTDGLKLVHFDTSVNQGIKTANKCLQKAIGVIADGNFGPVTLKSVQSIGSNENSVYANYCSERALRYAADENFQTFGRGWFNRLFSITLQR